MKLTREQILDFRERWSGHEQDLSLAEHEALCDMALASLEVERELALANARIDYLCSPDSPHSPEGGEWTLVPQDERLGAFVTCTPGKPVYAIDERGVPLNTPFRVWRIVMPELPPLNETPMNVSQAKEKE